MVYVLVYSCPCDHAFTDDHSWTVCMYLFAPPIMHELAITEIQQVRICKHRLSSNTSILTHMTFAKYRRSNLFSRSHLENHSCANSLYGCVIVI